MAQPHAAIWVGGAAALLLLIMYMNEVSLDSAVPVKDGSNRRRPEPSGTGVERH